MKKYNRALIAIIIFLGIATAVPTPTQAQSAITFGVPINNIDFPDGMTFEISVSSSAGEIISAELAYRVPGEVSFVNNNTYIQIEFSPSNNVSLYYEMDTEGLTVFPSTPYIYTWEVTDSAGNTVTSEEYYVRYDDTRYDWDIIENADVAVWSHNRPASFGKSVFAIAEKAIKAQYPLYQVDLEFQFRIIIYNSSSEFAGWHSGSVSSIGGEANPNIGVTTQIVSLGNIFTSWLNDVIPHEISHLYFAQAAYNPKVSIPTWLNEGVATYNEFSDTSHLLKEVEALGKQGELVSLSKLESGFGRLVDESRFRLGYSESLSAVTYMVETFGQSGLANLLAAYKSGLPSDEAFLQTFGVDTYDFELGWATWLGIPEGSYLIPTPWPFPTFPPSPTPFIIGAAPQPAQTAIPEVAQLVPTPTLPPPPIEGNSDEVIFEGGSLYTAMLVIGSFTCGSIILLMGMLWFFNNRRKP